MGGQPSEIYQGTKTRRERTFCVVGKRLGKKLKPSDANPSPHIQQAGKGNKKSSGTQNNHSGGNPEKELVVQTDYTKTTPIYFPGGEFC